MVADVDRASIVWRTFPAFKAQVGGGAALQSGELGVKTLARQLVGRPPQHCSRVIFDYIADENSVRQKARQAKPE